MKRIISIIAIAATIGFFSNTASAQVNVSINIGHQPAWGPVGYDYAGYYYLPDIDTYYDVNLGMFYYPDRGRWISARYLPEYYSRYDLYRLHKVVINTHRPWMYNHSHRSHYARYRGYHNQHIIRDSRDHRYYDSRNNHTVWYNRPSGNHSHKNHSNYNNNRRDYNAYDNHRNYDRNNDRNKNHSYGRDNNRDNNKKEYRYERVDNNRNERNHNTSGRNDNRNNRNDNRSSNGRR